MSRPSRPLPRLRLNPHLGHDVLDGGWWPRSRDLSSELSGLVDHFPAAAGRIVRAMVSPPDWDGAPPRVPTSRGYVRAGSFRYDDTHVVLLHTSERDVLTLLVVPPEYDETRAEAALQAASWPGNRVSARSLLPHLAPGT